MHRSLSTRMTMTHDFRPFALAWNGKQKQTALNGTPRGARCSCGPGAQNPRGIRGGGARGRAELPARRGRAPLHRYGASFVTSGSLTSASLAAVPPTGAECGTAAGVKPNREPREGLRFTHLLLKDKEKNKMQTWNHLACRSDAKAARHFCLSRTSGESVTDSVSSRGWNKKTRHSLTKGSVSGGGTGSPLRAAELRLQVGLRVFGLAASRAGHEGGLGAHGRSWRSCGGRRVSPPATE